MQNVETKINGFDTQGLKTMVDKVAAHETEGIARFQVATRWQGGTRSETSVNAYELGGRKYSKNFKIVTDEPCELLGENCAPNPQEVLMAGLNACMTVGYVAGCSIRGIELESLEIETEGELNLRGFLGLDENVKPGYDELRYNVRIKGNGTPQQFEEIHKTVMATSPNYWNMANPIQLVPQLIVEQ